MVNSRRRRKKSAARKISFLILALILAAIGALIYAANRDRTASNRNVRVVRVDPRKMIVRPELARPDLKSGEPFSAMIARLRPEAAINGTYFDKNCRPLGDILVEGKLVNRGGQRHAVAITKAGAVSFIRRGKKGFDWSGYWSGIAAGPRLVHNGKVALDPTADGFSKRSLIISAWRSGIGVTKDNILLLVAVSESITLAEFADIMLELGAVEAMNLDGGGACALYNEGRKLVVPGLSMTNTLMVYNVNK